MRFATPPGWPQPPAGWQPPPGWQPDPSWPPAPNGWQWWRRPRRHAVGLGFLVGLPIVAVVPFFGLLIAAQVADDRAGCGSVDPTDPANYSAVTIANDTTQPVVV